MGFRVDYGVPRMALEGDIFVTWNRIGDADRRASEFQAIGATVLVAENAAWGNGFNGARWYSIARNYHNTADCFDHHGPERWDCLGVPLEARRMAGETVVLPQRGIGSPPTAMPAGWAARASVKHGGRIRAHPGKGDHAGSLRTDLARAQRVVTWGSGAAILAALWGCKVISEMPGWIGEHQPEDRLEMFRRLAWAQWRLEEIESGEAFARLLAGGFSGG